MPSHWKDWFDFTYSERNGFILLIFLVVILTVLPRFYPLLIKQDPQDFTRIKQLLSELEAQRREDSLKRVNDKLSSNKLANNSKLPEKNPPSLFQFDPNLATYKDFLKLGFSQKLSHTIINYREKGGKFYKKEDLKKIYGLKQDEYQRVENFISIPSENTLDDISKTKKKLKNNLVEEKLLEPKNKLVFELNSADSLSLLKIHGIGPSFSSRILKYRKLLGGYRSKSQLLEVYGMDSARWGQLIQNIEIDTSKIEKISINTAEWIDLVKHPYIDKKTANNIINHRKYDGQFVEVTDLKNYYLVNKQLYRKIAPYLKTDDRVEAKKTD